MLKQTSRQLTLTAALTLSSLPILLTGATSVAHAQSAGNISGTVTDPSGAIVPGASIVLKNSDTNGTRTSTADASGLFSFSDVQPGPYTLTTTSAGFAPTAITLTMTIGGNATLNPELTISNSNTVVEVSADQIATVNTASPEVSQVINAAEISQLPSLTRNPYDFVALSGNVSAGDNTDAGYAQNGSNRGVSFSLNGQRNSGTEILLDGVENLSVFGDAVGIRVPIDAVREYRIITNNFAPEYGRASGGVVAVATQAGTNVFHGRAWEFNRISATTANTVSNAQAGQIKGVYTRNQFGGAVGGPIIKDKLFFFSSAEFTRVRSAASSLAAIPSAELLAAASPNVQSFFATYSGPSTARVVSQTTNLQAGSPDSTGAQQPRYNPAVYPTLTPGTPVFNNVAYTAPIDAGGGMPQNTYNITGRVDYNLGQKTQTFFRYVDYHEIDQSGSAFASPYSQYNVGASNIGQAYLLSAAHEFSPKLTALTKLSFSRNANANQFNTALQNTPTLYISSGARNPAASQFAFQLPGFYDFSTGAGGLPYGGPQNTIQYNQDVSYTAGTHQVQVGAQVLYIQDNQSYGAYAQAVEALGRSQSTGLQNFLTGNMYQFSAAVNPQGALPCAKNQYTGTYTITPACSIKLPATQPVFARSERFHDWAAYAQDQWKVTPKFTLSYGVRYEYFGVQHDNKANLDANFVYGPGTSLAERIRTGTIDTVPNSPVGALWHPQYGTVSPRLGFALDVFGNGKSSLRGGYGISYERNFGNVTFNIIQNPPNYAVIVLTGTAATPVPVTNSNSGPLSGTGTVALPNTSARAVDQNIRTAQTQFYSLSLDQQLGRGTVVEVSYNGSRGIHLYDIKNYNGLGSGNATLGDPYTDPVSGISALTRLNPYFSNINNRGSNGDNYYQAVNVQFQTQDLRHTGLSIVANYTFAHATDDLSTTFSEDNAGNFELGYTNPFNPSLDHGSSDFDIRHRFVLAPMYRTPAFFKGSHSYLAQSLGGWELTGIYTVRTGTPFTFYDSTNNVSGYNVVRYNPITPVTQHTFKSIPKGAKNGGNSYTLTGANTLPLDNAFGNPALGGASDWGPYPSTMTQRNAFRGPGAYNLNVSVSKTFPIHERLNLELRAEGFDVTNHHNLYIQGSQLDAANFIDPQTGNPTPPQITGSKGGINGGASDERRFLQFAGKINF